MFGGQQAPISKGNFEWWRRFRGYFGFRYAMHSSRQRKNG